MSSRGETYKELHKNLVSRWGNERVNNKKLAEYLVSDPELFSEMVACGITSCWQNKDEWIIWFNLEQTLRLMYSFVVWYRVYGGEDAREYKNQVVLLEDLATRINPNIGNVMSDELYEDVYVQESLWMIERYFEETSMLIRDDM